MSDDDVGVRTASGVTTALPIDPRALAEWIDALVQRRAAEALNGAESARGRPYLTIPQGGRTAPLPPPPGRQPALRGAAHPHQGRQPDAHRPRADRGVPERRQWAVTCHPGRSLWKLSRSRSA